VDSIRLNGRAQPFDNVAARRAGGTAGSRCGCGAKAIGAEDGCGNTPEYLYTVILTGSESLS
jgi:hypothetical protein